MIEKVYIVYADKYEPYVLKVFKNKENAQAFIKQILDKAGVTFLEEYWVSEEPLDD